MYIAVREAVVRVERDDLRLLGEDVVRHLNRAAKSHIMLRHLPVPLQPQLLDWIAALKHEPVSRFQAFAQRGQGVPYRLVRHQALKRVSDHRRTVERRFARQAKCNAVDPCDLICSRTSTSKIEHRRCGINADNRVACSRQTHRERAGSASDVRNAQRGVTDLGLVKHPVVVTGVQRVVHADEPIVRVVKVADW